MSQPNRRTAMLASLASVVLALAPRRARGASYRLKLAHDANSAHPFHQGFSVFKQSVELGSQGRIEVEIFPAGQLGPENAVNELVRAGLVMASWPSAAGGLSSYVPDIDALNTPFLFNDEAHFYRAIDGAAGWTLAAQVAAKLDAEVIGWTFNGARHVWNSRRPVSTPADLKGLKLRVINTRIMIACFQRLGVQVTPMAFGEIYNAMQQKVIDGAENDVVDIKVEKFFEVSKYVSLTRHLHLAVALVLSRRALAALPADLQLLVRQAAAEGLAVTRGAVEAQTIEARQFLESKGLIFNQPDLAAFQAAVIPIYTALPASASLRDLVAGIRALA
jgi:tripartite ATP-independent transporter DctP family solute receptor